MRWFSLFLSFRGQLAPGPFFGALRFPLFLGVAVLALTPDVTPVNGYRIRSLVAFAYMLAVAWPVAALSVKRLRDCGRAPFLAAPVALAPALAAAVPLAIDRGDLVAPMSWVALALAVLVFAGWALLVFSIYRCRDGGGDHAAVVTSDTPAS